MANIAYHGGGFIEVEQAGVRLFVDPLFSRTRRGRRVRTETRACDYVLVTAATDALEEALDILEDHPGAALVSTTEVCREARRELRLARDRTLDLEEWERASDGDLRITAVPLTRPTAMTSGLAWLEGMSDTVGNEFSRLFAQRLPNLGLRALGALPMRTLATGEPALGFLLEFGSTRVALLGQGIHEATDERDLEDLASLGAIDTVVLEAVSSIAAVVRAVRLLEPRRVLIYRGHDPYGAGRRALAVRGADSPLSAYVDAIAEDQAGRVEARVLRPEPPTTPRAGDNATAANDVTPNN